MTPMTSKRYRGINTLPLGMSLLVLASADP